MGSVEMGKYAVCEYEMRVLDYAEQYVLAKIRTCANLPFERRIEATLMCWAHLDLIRTARGVVSVTNAP